MPAKLGPAFHGKNSLKLLKLNSSRMNLKGFSSLCANLMINSSLEELQISENDFTIPDPRLRSCTFNGLEVRQMISDIE
jgi:hypothetical protein